MMMMTTGMTTFLNNIITSCDNNGDSDDNYTTFITRFILVKVIYSEPSTTIVLNIKDIH